LPIRFAARDETREVWRECPAVRRVCFMRAPSAECMTIFPGIGRIAALFIES
jgi:hypothetical protein